MDDNAPEKADVIDLVIQLCTRIGMMMEDVCPVALDASRDGLEERVSDIRGEIRAMATIADAAEALL